MYPIPSMREKAIRLLLLVWILSFFIDPADAAGPAKEATSPAWQTLSENRLASMRGGFDIGGLVVSFGITRAVYINGALMTETTLNLGQLSQLTPGQAAQLGNQIGKSDLIQTGMGNSVQAALAGGSTVIQNTLNNQNISVQTMINANTNGMGLIRDMNTARTISDALAGSAGTR